MSKTRSTKSVNKRTFHPNIDSIQAVFLQHYNYPELTTPMDTAYSFTTDFANYLNANQDAFEDVAKFIPAVKENIIDHVQVNVFNTTDKTHIETLMQTKTTLLVEIAKNKCAQLLETNNTNLDRALNFVSKTKQSNTLVF